MRKVYFVTASPLSQPSSEAPDGGVDFFLYNISYTSVYVIEIRYLPIPQKSAVVIKSIDKTLS